MDEAENVALKMDTVFETGLSVLFGEPEINCGEAGSQVNVCFNQLKKIQLEIVDVNPTEVFLFAHHVWKASALLSKLLIEQKFDLNVKEKLVLELGAGTGLVSIVAGLLGAQVISSDYPSPSIIQTLEKNLKTNLKPGFQVVGHAWGGEQLRALSLQYDYIFMADTLWIKDQHENLLSDLWDLIKPRGQVVGCAGLHTGHSVVQGFFDLAKQKGFLVEQLDIVLVPIGSGLCENMEWESCSKLDDGVEQRKRYQIVYRLSKPMIEI